MFRIYVIYLNFVTSLRCNYVTIIFPIECILSPQIHIHIQIYTFSSPDIKYILTFTFNSIYVIINTHKLCYCLVITIC